MVQGLSSSSRTLSFCAEPVTLCKDVEFITGVETVDTFYQANDLISSNSQIGNNFHVVYQSNTIELLEGFEVVPASIFHAIIADCN